MMRTAILPPSRRRSMVGWLVVPVVVVLIVAGARQLMAAAPVGCGQPISGSIVESKQFTPYESRLTHLPEVPIVGEGQASAPLPAAARIGTEAVDGLARQFTIVGNNSIYSYFLDQPLGTMSASEFLAAGGIQLAQDPVTQDESFAAYLVKELGDRATAVKVGAFDGALTWADPEANGIRSHNLYWSDGAFNYEAIANRSAEELVGIGRGFVC